MTTKTEVRIMPRDGELTIVKKDSPGKGLRFGDLIQAVYEHCGKASAKGLLRLAVNAHLIAFPGRHRFMIVQDEQESPRF